jgi:RHS repeat-associated protein
MRPNSKAFSRLQNLRKYNGIELNNDLGMSMYDAFYRNLDPQTGRWWQIDPKPNTLEAPYASMGNNPILKSDPLGDTTIVDKVGKIIRQAGKDNLVYLEKNGQSRKIGEIGGKIDANEIYKNLLDNHIVAAKDVFPWTFKKLVRNKGPWDLKNDMKSVFGLANFIQNKKKITTSFQFEGKEYTAQELGNHHYGATGKATLLPEFILLQRAGAAQIAAGTSLPEWQRYTSTVIPNSRFGQGSYQPRVMLPPYGDDPADQLLIKEGFSYFYKHSLRLGLYFVK